MAQLVTLANAVLAVLPAAAVFFAAYGRYDGAFQDNVVFLHFMGGLLLGGFLGVVSLFALGLSSPLVEVVLLALFYPITVVAAINRRKWQGERHAVFNGGALGLGVAVMLGFTLLYRLFPDLRLLTLAERLALSAALAGLFFGVGLLAGNAVRLKRPFRLALLGTAILFAPSVFVEEVASSASLYICATTKTIVTDCAAAGSGFSDLASVASFAALRVWLWVGLLLAYGAVFAFAADRRIMVEGLTEEARKERRRRVRARG